MEKSEGYGMFDFSSMKTRLVMVISGVSLASTILIGGFFIFENVRENQESIASYRQDIEANVEAQLKEEKDHCWREAFKRHFLISKQPELTMQQRVDALLVRSIKIIIKEHLKKIALNLPKVIDELVKLQKNCPEEYERYQQYFNALASNDGLKINSVDHTNALDRSFGYIFRGMIDYDKNKRKSMLWQCGLEMDDDHILVQESIQDIMSVLTDFKQLDTEHLAWVEEYRSALEKVQTYSRLDFMEFFALMLKMDVIVELRNIGMVNYD